jgi:hypothetical protein
MENECFQLTVVLPAMDMGIYINDLLNIIPGSSNI